MSEFFSKSLVFKKKLKKCNTQKALIFANFSSKMKQIKSKIQNSKIKSKSNENPTNSQPNEKNKCTMP
jgi:hypothetical protein